MTHSISIEFLDGCEAKGKITDHKANSVHSWFAEYEVTDMSPSECGDDDDVVLSLTGGMWGYFTFTGECPNKLGASVKVAQAHGYELNSVIKGE